MSEFNDGYDGFMDDATRDDRIGKHKAMVSNVTQSVWAARDGQPEQPYTKVAFRLVQGGTVDLTWSPPPEPPPTKEELAGWTRGRKMGVANAVNLRRQLAKHYGKTIGELREGDSVAVEVRGVKSKKDGNVYPRVVAFLPLADVADGKQAEESSVPF